VTQIDAASAKSILARNRRDHSSHSDATHMQPLQILSLLLDVILVIAAVAAFMARPRIGGQLAKGMRTLLVGVVLLGLAHFIETALFAILNLGTEANEVIHRLLIALAFAFVIWGLATMRRTFTE
jgi:hypothetical protein